MPTSDLQTGRLSGLVSKVSPLQYVAACLVVMFLRPASFMVVGLTVAILSHAVLIHAGFLEVTPTVGQAPGYDGPPLLRAYRRAAPFLVTLGLILFFVDVPVLGAQAPGLLVASGTALIFAVKMISFAGTDAR
jgi:hypothetical protein